MLWGISEMMGARAFKPLPLCLALLENLLVGNFWSTRNKRKSLSKQKCVFEKMLWGILRNDGC